jgi:hypothetical protein
VKTLCTLVTLAFLIVAPIRCGYCFYDDMNHPERWKRDPLHDPHIWVPLGGVPLTFMAIWIGWEIRKIMRFEREREERRKRSA